ncbi:MAG: dynamin family protein [Actinomycetota bacterium]
MSATSGLLAEVEALVRDAIAGYAGTPQEPALRELSVRLGEPLRVAIAGRVKAGKSTLLNALVGQELAPTDAGESTRIVTWYRNGVTYRGTLFPEDGDPVEVPFVKDEEGVVRVDLHGYRPEDVSKLEIEWPSRRLVQMTLIDTPGIASLSTAGQRTMAFLAPGEEGASVADAILYLMRHVHRTDVRFLEAFHEEDLAEASPVNAVGVLSRADEIGVARLDALDTANRIAARYRTEPVLRRLCQTVLPVSALVAEAGATLTQDEFGLIARIAARPEPEVDDMLLSVDRFVEPAIASDVDPEARRRLLHRMGLFGIRFSISSIRSKEVQSAPDLASRLVDVSGLEHLRSFLATQLTARRDALKARSALLGVRAALRAQTVPASDALARATERIDAGAHEFAEIRLMVALRSGETGLRDDEADAAERLLVPDGAEIAQRVGLSEDASPDAVKTALLESLSRWQQRAENPMSGPNVVEAARILVRSTEGLIARAAVTTPNLKAPSGPDV